MFKNLDCQLHDYQHIIENTVSIWLIRDLCNWSRIPESETS